MTDQWLAFWTSNRFRLPLNTYIGIYVAIGVAQVIFITIFGLTNAYFGATASKRVHADALAGIFNAPISFFDSTPVGRITSRFSRDVDTLDNLLPESLRTFLFTLFFLSSNFVLISVVFPMFLIPLVPMVVVFYLFQKFYRNTSRELKRLDSVTRSPLVATISETIGGISTIRAYGSTERFEAKAFVIMNYNNMTYYPTLLVQRWMQLRLESLNSFLIFCAALFAIIARDTVDAGVSGLAISYAFLITSTFSWCIKQATDSEMNMNSAERMIFYIENLPSEREGIVPVPHGWPSLGHISAKELRLRYRPELPLVIDGVSFDIQPSKKIGIVGRTGAGKSSVLSLILRLFEYEAGTITIDGVDISSISLTTLRSAIAVIPQDPVLFSGTIRFNLDPFSSYTDLQLHDVLRRCGLHDVVMSQPEGLEAMVAENGSNWSTGQRQLICLCRAMLKNSRIIMLDEATASVDFETDSFIQQAIRFSTSTFLTIAHRLNTIADYDIIMVMAAGKVVEFDSPKALLSDPNSEFSKMVDETGAGNAAAIRLISERGHH